MEHCNSCNRTDKLSRFRNGDAWYCPKHYSQLYRYGYTFNGRKSKRQNTIKIDKSTTSLFTVRGEEILIDTEDLEKIKTYYWSLNTQGYVITNQRQSNNKFKHIRLHLLLLGKKFDHLQIDHINGNKLDNRKSNLRLCTHQQNCFNIRLKKNNKTGIAGVSPTRNDTWRARIMINKQEIRLGHFRLFGDAIQARWQAEEKYFGKFRPIDIQNG
jgi:hypothetical protein